MQAHLPHPHANMHAVGCAKCGAPLTTQPTASGHLHCGHCGHVNALSHAQVAQLRAYHQAVAAHDWAAAAERSKNQRPPITERGAIIVFLGLIGFLFGPVLVSAAGLRVLILPVMMVTLFTSVGFLVYELKRRRPAVATPVPTVSVTCPQCGGHNVHPRGMPLQHCVYCGASLVASPTLMQRGVEASELGWMAEKIRRLRRERQLPHKQSKEGGYALTVLSLSLLPATWMLALSVRGMAAHGVRQGNLVLALFTGAYVALVGSFAYRNALRKKGFNEGLGELCASIQGMRFNRITTFVTWLNAHWCADHTLRDHQFGLYAGAVGWLDGFPVAIELCTGVVDARILVFIGAYIPSAAVDRPHVDPQWRSAGFDAAFYATGLKLSARPEGRPYREIMASPELVAELATTLRHGVDHVKRWGGRPVTFPA